MADKLTKKDYFEKIKNIVTVFEEDIDDAKELIDFVQARIDEIDKKNEKAKERAARARKEGDELRSLVESKLTKDFQPIDAIVDAIGIEDVTKAKVTARLTQLVKCEIAEKDNIKTESGRKIMAYRLKQKPEEEIVEDSDGNALF